MAAPFGSLAEAVAAAADGSVLAIAVGDYELTAAIERPLTLRGACADTVVSGSFFALRIRSPGVTVENLRMSGASVGIRLEIGAEATIRDVVFEDNLMIGVNADGATVDVEHVLVAGAGDTALTCATGALDAHLVEVRDVGGVAFDARRCTAAISDATIRGVGARAFPQLVNADDESMMTIQRAAFTANRATEIAVIEGGSLSLEDIVVRTPAPEDGVEVEPFGVLATEGTLDLARVRILNGRRVAVGAAFPGTLLRGSDVWISETIPGPLSTVGYALEVSEGAAGELARVHVDGATAIGVLVSGEGSSLTLDDATVIETRADPAGAYGRAVQVQLSSTLAASRLVTRRSREGGVVVTSAEALLEDVVIDEVLGGGLDGTGPAIGLGAYLSADVDVTRFSVSRIDLAGLQIASESELDLFDGEVRDNPIGVNVQVADYDLSRLMDRVFYRNNGVSLDAEVLPVPDPTVGVAR
jgi:hypothetical protein